jgi:lipopolysaccharide biosynthesis regulator YciM
MDLEQKIVHARQPLKAVDVTQKINELLLEANRTVAEEKSAEAEEKYIAILELNPHHIAAYQGLIKVYIEMRDYRKARETARYLIKLLTKKKSETYSSEEKHELAGIYEDLSYVYELEKKYSSAATNSKRAAELEPNNPRFLDSLVKISILVKDKKAAQDAFNALKQADPDNQKLEELQETIEQLSGQEVPSDTQPVA